MFLSNVCVIDQGIRGIDLSYSLIPSWDVVALIVIELTSLERLALKYVLVYVRHTPRSFPWWQQQPSAAAVKLEAWKRCFFASHRVAAEWHPHELASHHGCHCSNASPAATGIGLQPPSKLIVSASNPPRAYSHHTKL